RELPADAAMVEARVAAERAIALEEAPESHRVLGTIRLVADWDWSGARKELARAVALEPKWDFGFVAYGRVLSAAGDDTGASAAVQRRFEAQDPAVALETFLERSIAMNAAQGPGRRARATHVAALETLRGHPDAALGWLEQAAREHDPDLVYALRDPEFGAL